MITSNSQAPTHPKKLSKSWPDVESRKNDATGDEN